MLRWPLPLLGLLVAACHPTYAPPVRTPHYGAPSRAQEGDVVVGGAAAGGPVGVMGGPTLEYGLRDWVSLEGGADINRGQWTMGWAGARFTHAPHRHWKNHVAADLETGAGLGWGGQLCGNDPEGDCSKTDDREFHERLAGGGLLGGGIGGHFSFFAIYARARAQLTGATNVPATFWGTAGGGVQFRIAERVDLFTQASYWAYTNRVEWIGSWIIDLGIAIRIPRR